MQVLVELLQVVDELLGTKFFKILNHYLFGVWGFSYWGGGLNKVL